jgi:FLVCR family MFS transporter 7
MGQISGVLFVFLFEILLSASGSIIPPMLAIAAITAAEIPLTLRMKESHHLMERPAKGAGNTNTSAALENGRKDV